MSIIKSVTARRILDSRGIPTIECTVNTSTGKYKASVPSGKSKGKHEAHELRDNTRAYNGKDVQKAIKNINTTINRALKGKKVEQNILDNILIKLDGTPNKRKLGANATLAVSIAICRAEAGKTPLYKHIAKINGTKPKMPTPVFNLINGGQHAGNHLDIQEYLIIPQEKTTTQAIQSATETYHALKDLLFHHYGQQATNTGDEGGFAPQFNDPTTPFEYLLEALIRAGRRAKLAIDAAATQYYKNGIYVINGITYTKEQLIKLYQQWIETYNLTSIEDPFHEEDFEGFAELYKKTHITIVADDLTTTNPTRIHTAINKRSANCLLLKINQIGTITEALNSARLAKKAGWKIMVSHRSGETNDDFIADLAVGIGCEYIKAGAPCRGERVAKYNRLMEIEEEL